MNSSAMPQRRRLPEPVAPRNPDMSLPGTSKDRSLKIMVCPKSIRFDVHKRLRRHVPHRRGIKLASGARFHSYRRDGPSSRD